MPLSGEAPRGLAEQQAALRRVATLVARGVPPEEVFAAVTAEAGRVLSAGYAHLGRYEADAMLTSVAAWGDGLSGFPVGSRWSLGGKNVATLVFETRRPARVDGYADDSGPFGFRAREGGARSAVGTPVIVEGRLWGLMVVSTSGEQPLPASAEARLASFTELVATAIANAESRAALARLAQEQAALRRVATLVARGAAADELFAAVAGEVGPLLGAHLAGMGRYDSDDTVTVLAAWAAEGEQHPLVPGPWPLEGGDLASIVFSTGHSVRIDDYQGVPGRIAEFVRDELGIGSSVASPIVAEGRLWGVLYLHAKQIHQPFPRDAESRLTGFTELVATAVANAESRAELLASRARIVAAADEARRRIERDLHDGTQQQLVSLMLQLRAAQAAVPAGLGEIEGGLARIAAGLAGVFDRVREISHGIHPAILSEQGLARPCGTGPPRAGAGRAGPARRAAARPGRGRDVLRGVRGGGQCGQACPRLRRADRARRTRRARRYGAAGDPRRRDGRRRPGPGLRADRARRPDRGARRHAAYHQPTRCRHHHAHPDPRRPKRHLRTINLMRLDSGISGRCGWRA